MSAALRKTLAGKKTLARREPMKVLAAILLLTVTTFAAPAPWTPANFRGLIVGKAHRAEAVRTLGAPDSTQRTPTGEELTYRTRGDHKGDLTLRLDRSGVITQIEEAFPVAIPRSSIYKEFGKDALTGHYYAAKCAGGVLYRDPSGGIELTLFPGRGIALWPDQHGYDFAALQYLARQPGLPRPPACVTHH
jgi:hypothetical protein